MQRNVTYVKWRPILEFPDYHVSNNGMVKNSKTGSLVKQFKNKKNHRLYVALFKKEMGVFIKKKFYTHHLVFWAFSDCKKIPGHHIHHIDQDYLNNNFSNLEYISRKDHLKAHGGCFHGNKKKAA